MGSCASSEAILRMHSLSVGYFEGWLKEEEERSVETISVSLG